MSRYFGVKPKKYEDENRKRLPEELENYLTVRPGQLAMNAMWLNYRGLGVSEHTGLVSPAYRVFDLGRSWHPRFAHYLLRSDPYVAEFSRLVYGIRPNSLVVSLDDLKSLPVPLPPLPTQRAISAFLDRKTAAIDGLIEKKERLIALLAEKRAALIHQAVTKGLDPNVPMKDSGVKWIGEVPAHWKVRKLSHVTHEGPRNGLSPSVTMDGTGIETFSISVIRQGRVDVRDQDLKYVDAPASALASYTLKQNDILLVRGNGNIKLVGRAGLVIEDMPTRIYPDILMRIRVARSAHAPYLVRLLNSPALREQIELAARTTVGTFKVNNAQVRALWVVVPPLAEATELAGKIDVDCARLDAITARLKYQIDRLREYRQALITAAVTGQLQIPEEEAA